MSQLCRACLVARESFTYILFQNVSPEVYSFCTSIEVLQNDELPKTLCTTCYMLLAKFSNFKRACIQAENTLIFQRQMKLPKVEHIEVKCEINESSEMVVSELSITEPERSFDTSFDNDYGNSKDQDCNYAESCNGCEDVNTGSGYIKDQENETFTNDIGSDIEDNEPLKVLKKKTKPTVRKAKTEKAPKIKNKQKPKVFEYVCELCNSKFKYEDRYEAHKLEHQGLTVNKTCTICKREFMTWSGLQRHTDSEHKVVKMNTLSCKECGKVFKNQHTLKLHSKMHQLPEDHTCVCDICGKSYSSSIALKLHQESHNEDRARDFPCEHCGKKFFTKSILHSHIKRLHTGQRYICHLCNFPFTDKYNLTKHVLQIHQGVKDHKCDVCQKFFSTNSTLVIHKRIHSGERPYSCSYCAKAFVSKNRLIVHNRIHTGERPHHCAACNLSFTQLGSLKRHLKTHKTQPNGQYPFEKPADCVS